MMTRSMLWLRLCLLVALAGVLLSGCKIRSDLVIAPDGSGTFEYSIAIEDEYIDMFSQGGRDLLGEMEEKAKDTPFPVETRRFAGAKTQGVAISYEFESIADLEEKMAVSAGQDDALIKEAHVVDEGDGGWSFTATGGGSGAGSALPLDKEELKKILDITLSVTLPGPNPEGNADRIETHEDSATFTWQVPPGKSALNLRAATVIPEEEGPSIVAAPEDLERERTSGKSALVFLIAGAFLLSIAGWWVRSRRTTPLPPIDG